MGHHHLVWSAMTTKEDARRILLYIYFFPAGFNLDDCQHVSSSIFSVYKISLLDISELIMVITFGCQLIYYKLWDFLSRLVKVFKYN